MPAVIQLPLQHDAHQFLGGRTHVPEALSEGHHVEAVILQGLHHHGGIPSVIGDFPDVEPFAQLRDELLDEAVMHHVPLGRMDEALTLPFVVHHMIAPDAQLHGVLREPEVRQHNILLFIIPWREHQHHGRQVAGAGKVKPGIAGAAFQFIFIDSAAAFIPLVHGHPSNALLDPLVQTQLTEHVLIGWRFLGLAECVPYLVDGDRFVQGGICLVPVFFIRPVGVIRQAVEHGVEARIILPAFDDVQGFLMNLPADAVPVGSRRCQQEPKRLLPGVAAALGHDIIQSAGGLGVKLVEYAGADVQTVLGGHLR